tara:strand:+ start:537 stop:959 length:423 start_codon:yes stop_codon:yes gene_type:complete
MIKYNLKCNNKHEFESWFSNSEEFEKLKKKKLLECFICGSRSIKKSIMSPVIINSSKEVKLGNPSRNDYLKVKNDLVKLRKFVEKNFEFVGEKFADRVRNVYYDRSSKKNIYGVTTPEERAELEDEGIEFSSIPWVEKDN